MPLEAPITAEQLLEIHCEPYLFELIEGRLVVMEPPGWKHGATAMRVSGLLFPWIEERGLGIAFASETGFILKRGPDTVRAPDFAFVAAERAPAVIEENYFQIAPDFLVEVISTHDRPREVHDKARMWIESGAGEAWVMDPEARTVTVFRPDAEPLELGEDDEAAPAGALTGFRCAVSNLFPKLDGR